MVENGKKRNRNRNKNKNKGNNAEAASAAPAAEAAPAAAAAEAASPKAEVKPAEQPAKTQPKDSGKKKSPSPPKEVNKVTNGGVDIPVDNRSAEERQADLIKNLAMDMPPFLSNFVELRAAEARFHAGVNGSVAANGNADKVAERNIFIS